MAYRTTLTFTLALTIATTAAIAQPTARDPMTMEIAGVRLGQPAAQAKAGAEALGYSCRFLGGRLTFEEEVVKEVDERKGVSTWGRSGTAPFEMNCAGRAGEMLRVFFAQPRGGTVVESFDLYFDGKRSDLVAIRQQLRARYGVPARGRADFCTAARCKAVAFAEVPTFVVDLNGNVRVFADRGRNAREADAAAVKAAADRILPKKGASF